MAVTVQDAIAALTAYGYTLQGERYVKPGRSTQQWMPQGDGFLRFDDPGGVPTPYCVKEDAAQKQGLSHTDPAHQDHFEWLWPAAEVAKVYSHAAEQAAAGWPDQNEVAAGA